MKRRKGQLLVVSGPSGVGKSTVISGLMERVPELWFSVSFTTRKPRAGEVDGVNYHFVSREQFSGMIDRGEFLEYARYVDNYYGTSGRVIEEKRAAGVDVLLDIDVQGAAKVRERCPDALLVFIIPPSFAELSRRLRGRNTDDAQAVEDRLRKAREECGQAGCYDFLVVNDRVSTAVAELEAILTAGGCRTACRLHLLEGV